MFSIKNNTLQKSIKVILVPMIFMIIPKKKKKCRIKYLKSHFESGIILMYNILVWVLHGICRK